MADDEKKEAATDAEEVKKDGSENTDGAAAEGKEGAEEKAADPAGKLKLILMIVVPLLLVIIITIVLFMTPMGRGLLGLDHEDSEEHAEDVVEEAVVALPEHISYYEMPELLVNIQSSSSKRKPYLRLAVKFELHDPEAAKTIDLLKPRIIDSFQVYLRELRVDDLEGSAGSQRLKEELLRRVNTVAAPVKIMDVLFQVFVVQ